MSDPADNTVQFDTSKVVDPVEHLNSELKTLSNVIDEIDGQIATAVVQKARLVLMRDALKKGVELLYGGEGDQP